MQLDAPQRVNDLLREFLDGAELTGSRLAAGV
jgi:hypothetical protein